MERRLGRPPDPSNPNAPNHEHIHVVVRTPNGNDYGKDVLRQHYTQHPHSAVFGVAAGDVR